MRSSVNDAQDQMRSATIERRRRGFVDNGGRRIAADAVGSGVALSR
jgi:hypothetical protein